jgi:hypothetical protein
MTDQVSWDRGAPFDDVVEAVRRVFNRDGIPRHVYLDGKIMKYDWFPPEGTEDDNFEEHVQKLLEEQEKYDS